MELKKKSEITGDTYFYLKFYMHKKLRRMRRKYFYIKCDLGALVLQFDRTPLDIAIANGRTDIAQVLQLAQHTDIGNVEVDTVTIETTEPIMTETVTTSGGKEAFS